MIVLSVEVKDFLSVGHISLDFAREGLLLIEGWNSDTQSANGAGKSSVLSAITWCLFGKLPRDITSTSVVRSGQKSCFVKCTVECNGLRYTIYRSRSPNSLTIQKDFCEPEACDQDLIDTTLGIKYERFLQVSYFAQGLGQRFLDLSDTDKKQMFLDLSQSIDYNSAKQKIDANIKKLSASKIDMENKIGQYSGRVQELQESLESYSIQIDLNDLQDKLSKCNLRLSKLTSVSPPDMSEHKELRKKLKIKLSQIQEAKGELKVLHNQLRLANKPIEKPVSLKCPHCSESVLIDGEEVVACDMDALNLAYKKSVDKQNQAIQEINNKIKEVDILVSKEHRVQEALEMCESEMSTIQEDYLKTKEDIDNEIRVRDRLENSINSAKEAIKRSTDIKARIDKLLSEHESFKNSLDEIVNKLKILESASYALSPAGIQAYVLDSILDQFNEYVREILSVSWPSLSYELLSFKENKSGTISTKFSDSISISGVPRSLGALSGGERRCLSIAIDIAIARIYSLYSGKKVGPVILDEPFDHMDSTNRERAISILQSFSHDTLVIVVDHMNESKGLFDSIVTISKTNGVSSAIIE